MDLVRHQVALPPGYNYIPISEHVPPATPARVYPFTLDPFQKVAIASIQRSESVLVSAHTSAGKTVVAEYAIAQALNANQRVIYTSPIKALSNQKYRELQEEFGDVGLLTGDVSINPSAGCLVMTTEILRSMLYRGSEVMREVSWVIFDEIHYMRDKARGVVWEETLILLPHQVHYAFLSATIPNAMEFAEWVCKIHEQPCHVVYTDYRPTPLQHYIFPNGATGIYMVVDEGGVFREDNFQAALADMPKDSEKESSDRRSRKPKRNGRETDGPPDIYRIVKMIMQRNYNPVIVFAFGKKECELLALQMSQLDLNDDDEHQLVDQIFTNAINGLNEDDKQLPQIEHILPLLHRGIGIHHSGLLPLLKEVIEILFQEGLIKVLFATETFAMGLNMPAKTVVFSQVSKWDGKNLRYLTSGEYIQMSGRAGRRGLDERGIVIMMAHDKVEPSVMKNMIMGDADPLVSAFHLKYNMILNMTRLEGMSPEHMLRNSFYQFQNTTSLPSLEMEYKCLEEERDSIVIPNEEVVSEYYELRQQLEIHSRDMRDVLNHPVYSVQFLHVGRLVRIEMDGTDFGWGAVVSVSRAKVLNVKNNTKDSRRTPKESLRSTDFVIDVLLNCDSSSIVAKNPDGTTTGVKPPREGEKGTPMVYVEYEVIPVLLTALNGISTVRVFPPKDITSLEARREMYRNVQEALERFDHNVPLLDPVLDMGIKDAGFAKLMERIETLESRLINNPLNKSPRLTELYELYSRKMTIQQKLRALRKKIQFAHSLIQQDELKSRKRVLRRLGYLTSADVVDIKGRVACEINAGDELVLTELLMNRFFNDMSPELTAAVMSCFVVEVGELDPGLLREEFAAPYRIIKETATRIAEITVECKLQIDITEYISKFHCDMMEVVYLWTQGAKFYQICQKTDIFEGSIIRHFRNLEEALRSMVSAAKCIGNTQLESKFSEALTKIRRDIVFAASLYL